MNLGQLLDKIDGAEQVRIKDYNTQKTLYFGAVTVVTGVYYSAQVIDIYTTDGVLTIDVTE